MRLLDLRHSIKPALGAAAVVGCLAIAGGQLNAAPRTYGPGNEDLLGNPTRTETALDGSAAPALLARAEKTRDALGFPIGSKRSGVHVRDGFERAEYDEVSEIDSAGKVAALTQFDTKGRLRAAIRMDSPLAGASRPTRDTAIGVARRSALAAGLTVGTPSSTEEDQATGGWTVHWARAKDGVPVRGDETRVRVWPDGRVQSVAVAEHDLAAAPARLLTEAVARRAASRNLDRWFANRGSSYEIQAETLEWVEPNAAFDPARIADAPAPYRMAWVSDVKPSGNAAGYIWLMSVFVDAGNGNIIGGDFVE